MTVNQVLCFDLSDEIQHFLGSSHCEGRNHNISASVKSLLDNVGKKPYIIRPLSVASVPICGLHHHIIRFFEINRIFYQRLIFISNVSGKYNGLFHSIFLNIHFDAAGTKKMTCVNKFYPQSLSKNDSLVIRTAYKVSDHAHGVFHGISRNKLRFPLALRLTVAPFSLKHLDMGTVTEHNVAKIAGCFSGIDWSLKSFCVNCRKIAGMVHMRMRQKNKIQISRRHRNILILVVIRPLFHSAVYQKLFSGCFQIIAASGNLMCCSNKSDLHADSPFYPELYLFFSQPSRHSVMIYNMLNGTDKFRIIRLARHTSCKKTDCCKKDKARRFCKLVP